MIIFCDESGAKGKAKNAEAIPGELGVFAGYILRDDQVQGVKSALSRFLPAASGTDKMHITDLPPEQQNPLREAIFGFFLEQSIPCVYEAIYVAGFQAEYLARQAILEQAKQMRSSPLKVNVRAEDESLHYVLFQGLMAKAIAYYEDQAFTDTLTAVLDNVDKPIEKIFGEKTTELLSVQNPHTDPVRGFDLATKTRLSGEVRSTVKLPADFDLTIDSAKVAVTVQPVPDPLTVAADVLANSLWHHFNELNEVFLGAPLHNKQAVKDHALNSLIYGLSDNRMWDGLYAHPAQRQEPAQS